MTVQTVDATSDAGSLVRRGFSLADGIAVLVGIGLGWAAFGFSEQFYRVLDPTPLTWRLVWGAIFASLALGLMLPPGVALWLGRRALRRQRPGSLPAVLSPSAYDIDLSLFWTVLGGLALVTGLLLALTPMMTSIVSDSLGGWILIGWKRRTRARSRSMCLW